MSLSHHLQTTVEDIQPISDNEHYNTANLNAKRKIHGIHHEVGEITVIFTELVEKWLSWRFSFR